MRVDLPSGSREYLRRWVADWMHRLARPLWRPYESILAGCGVYLVDDRQRVSTIPTRTAATGPRAPDQALLLLHRMADGDESALAALYDQWSGKVHTLAFWILKDSDDAEDVVEETFWQVWRNASQFDPARASAAGWLMMIARTRALDRLRAQRRRVERTVAAASSFSEALQPDPIECEPQLGEALGGLPTEQRGGIQLAVFRGVVDRQISARDAGPPRPAESP